MVSLYSNNMGGHDYEWYNDGPYNGYLGLYDRTDSLYRFVVDPLGNIGIGTFSSGFRLDIEGTLRAIGITNASDKRWKKNISPIADALDKIADLNGVNYECRRDEYADKNFPKGKQYGLIAQEVENIIPELVNTDPDGYKSIEYGKLVAVLIEGMKEQQEIINKLDKKVTEMQNLRTELDLIKTTLSKLSERDSKTLSQIR